MHKVLATLETGYQEILIFGQTRYSETAWELHGSWQLSVCLGWHVLRYQPLNNSYTWCLLLRSHLVWPIPALHDSISNSHKVSQASPPGRNDSPPDPFFFKPMNPICQSSKICPHKCYLDFTTDFKSECINLRSSPTSVEMRNYWNITGSPSQ